MTHGTSLLRKIAWTLLAGFLSFSITGMLDKVFEVGLAEQLIVTVLIGGVALLVQYLADFERRIDESERVQRDAVENLHSLIRRGFASVDEATELMSEIEQSIIRHDLLKQVIRRSARITPRTLPLVRFLAESETRRLADTLQSLSDGHELFYDGEDREFILALARGTSSSLFAVSWATVSADVVGIEAGFWLSDLGARYLDVQRAAVRRDVDIRRIFVVESPGLINEPELRRTIEMQRSAGVQVRISQESEKAQHGGLSDFVVFDAQICYDTTQVTRPEAPSAPRRLTTRILLDETEALLRVERFKELWENALPVDQAQVSDNGTTVVTGTETLGPA
ncbi:hypothetical protein [Paractinoplanes durhamensis]|uniref:Phosphatidylserine/phosphatidylglycerophosphate/ cardiolipin synthase family protein n=1 Tax=Paractinoplanes durhamensis TaxID=113563 RepID=A0ABQ3YQZ1_9ACTN|nr:hypothetical protein [Actinoplanes durhamensis]GID99946.1 hypothetical protein Adu01nite_12970 [Actinoplanes durhamensis]